MKKILLSIGLLLSISSPSYAQLFPLPNVFVGGVVKIPILFPDGTLSTPSISFATEPTRGWYHPAAGEFVFTNGTTPISGFMTDTTNRGAIQFASNQCLGWATTTDVTASNSDSFLCRGTTSSSISLINVGATAGVNFDFSADGTLRLKNRAQNADASLIVTDISRTSASSTPTIGADVLNVTFGSLRRNVNTYSVTPALGITTSCLAGFKTAGLTADCTIATVHAGEKIVGFYLDVTVGFTCSGTCSGTKTISCGITTGASVTIIAAGFNLAATGTAGSADADLGTAMTRAAQIQGGYIPSWSTTTPIICRATSGTGNWGNGTTTFVNAGSYTVTLVTETMK